MNNKVQIIKLRYQIVVRKTVFSIQIPRMKLIEEVEFQAQQLEGMAKGKGSIADNLCLLHQGLGYSYKFTWKPLRISGN